MRGFLPLLLAAGISATAPSPADLKSGGQSFISSANSLELPRDRQGGMALVGTYGRLPVAFEANRGQAPPEVDFIARNGSYAVALASGQFELFKSPSRGGNSLPGLRLNLAGAEGKAVGSGEQPLPGHVNYLIGNDPTRWREKAPLYGRVAYANVYPGIDVSYYGNPQQLELDFVIAPGSDPSQIALQIAGAERVRLTETGALAVEQGAQILLQLHPPYAYQNSEDGRHPVAARYRLDGDAVRFELGSYDTGRQLVIDPVLAYASVFSGSGGAAGYAIAVDAQGSAYVTGDAGALDLAGGAQRKLRGGVGSTHAFVAKLSSDGTHFEYVTYLGGSSDDVGYGIAVNRAGEAFVTGDTRSKDFPLMKPLQAKLAGAADIFIAKLSADGSQLIYSTYFGGSGGERGLGIAVDDSGNAHVAGYTNSTDFPVSNALQTTFAGGNADGFVLKLNPTGSAAIYSTYLGGGNDRPDIATAIAVDRHGDAYVTGFTNSPDFPTKSPLFRFRGPTDAFVTKLGTTGSLIYSTHLGGKADDEAMAIAVDGEGNAYVAGQTESPDFPITPDAVATSCKTVPAFTAIGDICSGGDVFVTKINAEGSAIVYSTYLSGSRFEVARSIAVDAAGKAFIAGLTRSPDFPNTNALQKKYGGGDYDAFVVKLDASGSTLLYATFLGGAGEDGAYGIALDATGNAYVTGYSTSPDFPGRLKRPDRRAEPARAAFVAKIAEGQQQD